MHDPFAIARDGALSQMMQLRRPMKALEDPHIPLTQRRNPGNTRIKFPLTTVAGRSDYAKAARRAISLRGAG